MTEQEIVDAYVAGARIASLAQRAGCRSTVVSAILRSHGVHRGRQGWRKVAVGHDVVIRQRGQSESAVLIAADYGVHPATIRRILGERVSRKPRTIINWSDEEVQSLGERWERGERTADLAREMNVSESVVVTHLKRAGYRSRHVREYVYRWAVSKSGYVEVTMPDNDPFISMRKANGWVAEHRLIMAQHLGRALERFEYVHHKDGVRHNNDIQNLQLLVSQPKGAAPKCRCCGSFDIEWVQLIFPSDSDQP